MVPSLNFCSIRQYTISPPITNNIRSTYSTASVVEGVGHSLLDALRETLLQSLGNDAVAGGVGDLASLLVGAGVVERVGDLLLDVLGDL